MFYAQSTGTVISGRERERERERERLQTSDGLLYFGHRPIYKPQNTKLNYAHRQTNKTYKQQNTQTNKTDINKQTTNKNNKQKKSGPNSHTEIMRDYGGR